MPRSRGSEMPQQRQSPRAPLHLKPAAISEANSIRSLKLHYPVNEMKKGSRVADLETKLGHAEEELKHLKKQLAAVQAVTIDLQMEAKEDDENEKTISMEEEMADSGKAQMEKETTDVFEIPPMSSEEDENVNETQKTEEVESPENTLLRSILAENLTVVKKAEELQAKLTETLNELGESINTVVHLREKIELAESAKALMEVEMKRLRIQTDQWRKAAEAAASVISSGDGSMNGELNGRRLCESGRSMDYDVKVNNGVWPPVIAGEDVDNGEGGGKRRGGIRVLGELWKKKGQLK